MLIFDLDLIGVEKEAQVNQAPGGESDQTPVPGKMTLTGIIAKPRQGYVLRSRQGDAPGEIYTILNADSAVLEDFVKDEKTVTVEARVVSGDNLDIEKINGKNYP